MAARLYFLLICAICIECGQTLQLKTRVENLESDRQNETSRVQNLESGLQNEKSRVQNVTKALRAAHDFIKNNANITEELDEVKRTNIKLLEELYEVKAETKTTIDKQNYQIVENKEDILLLRALITEMNQKIKDFHPSTTTTATQQTSTEQGHLTTSETTVTTQQTTTEQEYLTTTETTMATQHISTPVPVVLPPCPDGWKKFQSTCYLFVKKPVTSIAAKSRCADLGGTLAEPDTAEKLHSIKQFMSQTTGHRDVWVGETHCRPGGTWEMSGWEKHIAVQVGPGYGLPLGDPSTPLCGLKDARTGTMVVRTVTRTAYGCT